MKAHDYQPAHAGNCACGKSWYHEEHFGGSRKAAADAYRADLDAEQKVPDLARELALGTRVALRGTHPKFPGAKGIVTYVEVTVLTDRISHDRTSQGFATIQIDGMTLPQNIPLRYLTIEPLVVPVFDSVEEAEAWLEAHNPVPQPVVPHFATQQEADEWLAQRAPLRPCKECGDPADHDGKPCSSVPRGLLIQDSFSWTSRISWTTGGNSNSGVYLRPGDTVTFNYKMTLE